MLSDWGLFARAVFALAIVLALMAAVAWVARRYLATGGFVTSGTRRRLRVIEHIMLDGKSRLVLVRRDDTEHLLVLGPAGATVVERGIAASDTPAPAEPTSPPSNKFRSLFRAQS